MTTTITALRGWRVIDQGTGNIPMKYLPNGEEIRNDFHAAVNVDLQTIFVTRDEKRQVFDDFSIPAIPPINENDADMIVRTLEADTSSYRTDATAIKIRFPSRIPLDHYLQQARARLQHPEWCIRDHCWAGRALENSIIHKSVSVDDRIDLTGYGPLDINARNVLDTYTLTLTGEESPICEITIDGQTISGTPAEIRALADKLTAAADNLEAQCAKETTAS